MTESSFRPQPWRISPVPTVFMDFTTGQGVLDNGHPIRSQISPGRKTPTLTDKLNSVAYAAGAGVEKVRIMFTGKVPPADRNTRHWLMVQTPGWSADRGHWLGNPPTGRFTHRNTGQYIEVRVASEWFGDSPLTPRQAREAWVYLDALLTYTFGPSLPDGMRTTLMLTPAATGTNLWAAAMPKGLDPEPVTDDIAAELHATSGQHHQDHLVSGQVNSEHEDVVPLIDSRITAEIPRFTYIDGRFMYASLCREIGTGPGVRLKRSEAFDLMENNPYARARYEVRFTVPHGWHHVGIFGIRHDNPADGWYYPNRPGAQGITWADASEVFVARNAGWHVEPLQAIVFNETMSKARKRFVGDDHVARRGTTKAKPLDLWADKLTKARDNVAGDLDVDPVLKKPIGAALRAILIQSIGNFASRGRGSTAVVDDIKDIPAQYVDSALPKGKLWVYTVPQRLTDRQKAFYRPEFSVQVWGRGRAKVLSTRIGGVTAGALSLPGESIIGINGDAIYTTAPPPAWCLPQEQGGADDGKAGRLRIQGHLAGPMSAPLTRAERDKLREKAQKAGTEIMPEDLVDQAAFPFEFDTTVDSVEAYQEGD
ncbi:hypothetical protein ACT3TB_16315 [Micrococcaceae sp. AOP34-BR2-30]